MVLFLFNLLVMKPLLMIIHINIKLATELSLSQLIKKYMDIDSPNESNGSLTKTKDYSSLIRPMSPDASGEGLPYAPENWPRPGDDWSWWVGKRVSSIGHYRDRLLYLPRCLSCENTEAQTKVQLVAMIWNKFQIVALQR